jgi:hypothetical protein
MDTPVVLVSSTRGLLLKVDAISETVLCSFQLHDSPITSLAVHGGYAVTGGADSKLRVWPLSFNDFLLEAHHESAGK